ncbi:prolyl oligopeptidase [Syncephalis plumigaleata]|nr:prolyl oligopeptidase [Syncephalis plumigaleata]
MGTTTGATAKQQPISTSTTTTPPVDYSDYSERRRRPVDMSAQAPSFFDPAEFTIHSTHGDYSPSVARPLSSHDPSSVRGTTRSTAIDKFDQNTRHSTTTPPITSNDNSQRNILAEIFSSRSANNTPPATAAAAAPTRSNLYRDGDRTPTTSGAGRVNRNSGLFTEGNTGIEQTPGGPSLPNYARLPRHFHDLEYDGESSVHYRPPSSNDDKYLSSITGNMPQTPAPANMTVLTGVPATPSFMKSTHAGSIFGWTAGNENQSTTTNSPVPQTVQKTKAAQMTLKEQEKLLDEKTKECFNLKLKIDKLEDLLAELGPADVQNALRENVNYRIKIHELTTELDRHKQLLVDARWAVETLRRQQQELVSNDTASIATTSNSKATSCTLIHRTSEDVRRQEELEAELAITRRELQELRANMGADDVVEERRQRQHDMLRYENECLQKELNDSISNREYLERELRESEEALAVCQAEAELAQEALGMVDKLEEENRFLRDQVAELTLELRDKDNAMVVGVSLDEQKEMQETIEQLHELLNHEGEETRARLQELEQSHRTILDEARDELNQATMERDELSYKLGTAEQQVEQLKVSVKEIANERNQLSDNFKSVQAELKLLKQKTGANSQHHDHCNEQQRELQQQLEDALMRNDELADICNKLEEATDLLDKELDATYKEMEELKKRPLPSEIDAKDDLVKELQMRLHKREDKLKRERTAARDKLAELVDERDALERHVISIQERNDRIQQGARDYLEEIKAIRQAIAKNPSISNEQQGIQRSLDNILHQLREKQQELTESRENLRRAEEKHLQETTELRKKLRKSDALVKQTLEQLESVNNRTGDIKAVLQSYGSLEQLEESSPTPPPLPTAATLLKEKRGPISSQSATHLPPNDNNNGHQSDTGYHTRPTNTHRRSMSYAASHSTSALPATTNNATTTTTTTTTNNNATTTNPPRVANKRPTSLYHRGQSQIPLEELGLPYHARHSFEERTSHANRPLLFYSAAIGGIRHQRPLYRVPPSRILRSFPLFSSPFSTSTFTMTADLKTENRPQPPVAKKVPYKHHYHGREFPDDYNWLRDDTRKDEEMLAYIKAENEYAEAMLKPMTPLKDTLYNEFIARLKEDDEEVPQKKGDYLYYTRTVKDKQYPIRCRKRNESNATEEILLDLNAMKFDQLELGAYSPSPNHEWLAYSLDTKGDEKYTVYFKNLKTNEILEETIPDTTTDFAWSADNKYVFYSTMDDILRPYRIYRHELGTKVDQDVLLLQEDDTKFIIEFSKTRSGDYIIAEIASSQTAEVHYLNAHKPTESFKLFEPRQFDRIYSVDHFNQQFLIVTNRVNNEKQINFVLCSCPVDGPTDATHWDTILAHDQQVYVTNVVPFSKHVVVTERSNALPQLRVLEPASDGLLKSGASQHYIDFPEVSYSVSTRASHLPSFITPASVFDYDLATRQRTLRKQTETSHLLEDGPESLPDSMKIPITIVYRKDKLRKDGTNPGWLYGYAHIRGGAEWGRAWYELDGKFCHKKNTFRDFIAAAEKLFAEKYTRPEFMAMEGRSAGGLLMGSVVNMRPDIAKIAIAGVPFVDVINTMMDASIPLTVNEYEEWGNPNEVKMFDYMLSYSPYDNLSKTAKYPNMLIRAGLNDPRVQYWEPTKWCAKLREYKANCNGDDDPHPHDILLLTKMGSGHFGASGRYDYLKDTAIDYAYVITTIEQSRESILTEQLKKASL